MVLSRRTSAHVHTVFHVNFSHVERLRQQNKAEYERQGARLTYMAFIAKAVIDALTPPSDRQRVARRRQRRLQEGRQSRGRRGARDRPDRSGDQERQTRRISSV